MGGVRTLARTGVLFTILAALMTAGAAAPTVGNVTTAACDCASLLFDHPISGTSRLLLVEVSMTDSNTDKEVESIEYDGQSLTREARQVGGNGESVVELWRLVNPPTGNNTVELSIAGGQNNKIAVGAVSLTEVDQTDPIGGAASARGTGDAASVTVSSQPENLVADMMANMANGAPSVGLGQTERWNRGMADGDKHGAGSTEPGAASVVMNWTLAETNKPWSIIGLDINDDRPPKPVMVPPSPPDGSLQAATDATFNATVTDDSRVASCTLQLDGANQSMTATGNDTSKQCVASVGGLSDGQHTYTVFANDSMEQVNSSQTRTFTVDSTPPTVTADPSMTDASSRHAFNVSAIAEDQHWSGPGAGCRVFASDGNGNLFAAPGRLDAGFGSAAEAACNFTEINDSITGFNVDEIVDVAVEFTDAVNLSRNSSVVSHRIPNRAPGSPSNLQLLVPDLNFVVTDHPNATWTTPSDVEGDAFNVSVYVTNETGSQSFETEVVPPTNFSQLGNTVHLDPGENFTVEVQACDQWDCSAFSSRVKFHMNDRPRINTAGPFQQNVSNGDPVNITANVTDLEETLRWVNMTVWNVSGNRRLFANVNASRKGDIWTSQDFFADARGTEYNWTVNASDGFEFRTTTGTFTVGNEVPSIESGPSFTDYTNQHIFNVSAVASDSTDTDLTNATLFIDDGDGNTYTETRGVNRTFGSGTEAAANFSGIDNTTATGFAVGESLEVEITFRDTAGSTATTPSRDHAIPNRPPSVASANVTPATPQTQDRLIANYTFTDPEGDAVSCDEVEWWKNNESTGIVNASVDPDETSEGEVWTAEVCATDEFGAQGTPVNASPVTIQNTPTTLLEGLDVTNASDAHRATFDVNLFDPDGIDDVSCRFGYGNTTNWTTVDGQLDGGVGNTSVFACQGNVSAGDWDWIQPLTRVNVSISAGDEANTVTTNNTTLVIPNQPPQVSLVTPQDGAIFESGTAVEYQWTSIDPEGDPQQFEAWFYAAGVRNRTVPVSDSPANVTLPDGEYEWSIAATDQYNGTNLSTGLSVNRTVTYGSTTTTVVSGGGGGGTTIEQGEGILVGVQEGDVQERISEALLSDRQMLLMPGTMEVVSGGNATYRATATNIINETRLMNVSLRIASGPATLFRIRPEEVDGISPDKQRRFTVRIDAPSYLEASQHSVTFVLSGDIQSTQFDFNRSFTRRRSIPLRVHTVTEAEAASAIERAVQVYQQMQADGFNTAESRKWVQQARTALQNNDHDRAHALAQQVIAARQQAQEVRQRVTDLQSAINAYPSRFAAFFGVKRQYPQAQQLVHLAEAAATRQDYDTALQRLDEARLALESERSQVDPVIFLANYGVFIILGLILGSGAGVYGYRWYRRRQIHQAIEDLDAAEDSVLEQIGAAQQAYYVSEELGQDAFAATIEQLQDRISNIRQRRIHLRHQEVALLAPGEVTSSLAAEREDLLERIRELQEQYFTEHSLGASAYTQQISVYEERLAEIEKEEIMARLQKRVGGDAT